MSFTISLVSQGRHHVVCFFSRLVYFRPSSLLRQFLWRILRQCFSLWSSGILFWRLWNLIRLSIGMGFAEIMNFILGDLFFSRSSRSRDSTSKREALVGWTSRSVDVHRFKRVYRCERDGRRRIWRAHYLQAGPHQLFSRSPRNNSEHLHYSCWSAVVPIATLLSWQMRGAGVGIPHGRKNTLHTHAVARTHITHMHA